MLFSWSRIYAAKACATEQGFQANENEGSQLRSNGRGRERGRDRGRRDQANERCGG
ncbi:hypothetical protein Hdeb2414_s0018g00524761 [Helianthus debilis subsp. tardiflorus]